MQTEKKKKRKYVHIYIPAVEATPEEYARSLPDKSLRGALGELVRLSRHGCGRVSNRAANLFLSRTYTQKLSYAIVHSTIPNGYEYLRHVLLEHRFRFNGGTDSYTTAIAEVLLACGNVARMSTGYGKYNVYRTKWMDELYGIVRSEACDKFLDRVYFKMKQKNPTWTNRQKPDWWDETPTDYLEVHRVVMERFPVDTSQLNVYKLGAQYSANVDAAFAAFN